MAKKTSPVKKTTAKKTAVKKTTTVKKETTPIVEQETPIEEVLVETKELNEEEKQTQKEELDFLKELDLDSKVEEVKTTMQPKVVDENTDAELDVDIFVPEEEKVTTLLKVVENSEELTPKELREEHLDIAKGEKELDGVKKMTINDLRTERRHILNDEKKETNKVVEEVKEEKNKPKVLSRQALQWQAWLKYQKMTPELFMEKYPNHKMKEFILELVAFNQG